MKCPACGSDTTVRDTREQDHYVRRRRHCESLACGTRITTAEIIVSAAADGSDDALPVRPLGPGGVLVLPQRDVELAVKMFAEALARRIGSKAVADLLRAVLPAPTTTTGDKDNG